VIVKTAASALRWSRVWCGVAFCWNCDGDPVAGSCQSSFSLVCGSLPAARPALRGFKPGFTGVRERRASPAPFPDAPAHHADAARDDQEGGDEVEPRVELVGQDKGGEAERDQTERGTPIVCVIVTVSPSSTACRGVPREPTR
jgi:hypothetical protein